VLWRQSALAGAAGPDRLAAADAAPSGHWYL